MLLIVLQIEEVNKKFVEARDEIEYAEEDKVPHGLV